MIAWLSEWLREIIAVILIAVFVELLLPNKAMLRYVRLVVGLFILLTILSPILKALESDFDTMLDNGLETWSQSAAERNVAMQGLDDIERNAAKLSEIRDAEAAGLTERRLEDSLRSELAGRLKAPVTDVDAELSWSVEDGVQSPRLDRVTVTLKPSGGGEDESVNSESKSVEEVQPVAIDIQIEGDSVSDSVQGGKTADNGVEESEEAWLAAAPAETGAIRSFISQGWGIPAESIVVRRPAEQ